MKYRDLVKGENTKVGDEFFYIGTKTWRKILFIDKPYDGSGRFRRPISTRIRKSLEFRTLKRVCWYEGLVGADCGKNVLQDNKCSAKNCPIWARLPEVK